MDREPVSSTSPHELVEGLIETVIAVVRAAQRGFQHLVDRVRANVVQGICQELILEDGIVAAEGRKLDDVHQLAGLDGLAHYARIEGLPSDLDASRQERWCGSGRRGLRNDNRGRCLLYDHGLSVPSKSEDVNNCLQRSVA